MREPRIRAALAAALTAVLALGGGVAWLLYADATAPPLAATLAERLATDRIGPQLDAAVRLGVPLTGLLVAGAAWAAGGGTTRRTRAGAALAAGATAALLLLADGSWLQQRNSIEPDYTADAALYWGLLVGLPSMVILVGAAAWGGARPGGRTLPLRAGSALAAGVTGALLALGGLLWLRHVNNTSSVFTVDAVFAWGLVGGVPAAGLLIAAIAWAAAGRALRPVEAIRRELEDITAHSLDRRVPVPSSGDEITRLARTTNATLDRLANVVERRQRFVADASHELRSPLATLRASLEAALTHPDGVDWPETVRGALTDIERLQRLSDDLLLLTGLDEAVRPGDATVRLDALAHDLVEEYRHRRRLGTLHFTCAADEPTALRGSSIQLERLLRNLLDNACRHAHTTVEVTVRHPPIGHDRDHVGGGQASRAGRARQAVVLEVRDDGPGIPSDARERVFERFTRLDDARSRHTGGTGLGLAIAREIAVRHDGTLRAADSPRGARLVAEFPAHSCPPGTRHRMPAVGSGQQPGRASPSPKLKNKGIKGNERKVA